MKFCTKCDIRKTLDKFPKAHKMRDKHSSWCKDCINAHKREEYAANRQAILLAAKETRKNNAAHIKHRERQYRLATPDRQKGALLQKYWPGSTWQQALDNFKRLQEQQKGLCAICDKPETRPSKKGSDKLVRDLCVDHCHASGHVRGLLCDNCNTLIARAHDSYIICISAAGYLKRTLHDAIS